MLLDSKIPGVLIAETTIPDAPIPEDLAREGTISETTIPDAPMPEEDTDTIGAHDDSMTMADLAPATEGKPTGVQCASIGRDDVAMFRLLYPELRRLAHAKMALLPHGSCLQATALVHEVYIRLQDKAKNIAAWNGREHFLAVAARAMWFIIVDHVRHQRAQKRGGSQIRVTFTDADAAITMRSDELLDLERALESLYRRSPDIAEIVILRYIAGLTVVEIARLRQVTVRTIQRHWNFARAWLHRELSSRDKHLSEESNAES